MLVTGPNKGIILLVFACGLIAGAILGGFLHSPIGQGETHVIFTKNAPQPIGPYSQAVKSGDFVFLSGQIGINPSTGNLSGTIEGQTTLVMENLHAILQESGLGFEDVVQTRIYLVNMSDWTTVNRVYGNYFTDDYPARATVQVTGLPKGALVEIEMVALKR